MTRQALLTLLFFLLATSSLASQWNDDLYQQIEQSIQSPRYGTTTVSITRYGAKPSASAKHNQRAIQRAIDRCASKGGGRVVVPAGQPFLTGAIQLKTGVCLDVEEGATLRFAFQPELYPIVETSWEGLDCYNLSPCIYAFRAADIGITGKGIIDGSGTRETWWPWCGSERYGWHTGIVSQSLGGRKRMLQNGEDGVPMIGNDGKRNPLRTFTAADGMRPQLIGLNQCHRIRIEGVTLLRSPFWVLHPLKCTDVHVRNVHFENDGPNGDGCDPESCDRVLIEDCLFNTGDDCIAIKSGRNADGRLRSMPSQNVIIRRCMMKNGHGGVVIGSEISGGCRNVFAHDCDMDSPALERVLRIKTNSCRGGIVEGIHMRDIRVGQCREAVLKINLNYEPREQCCRDYPPTVRNIVMENVTCQRSRYGVLITGLDSDTLISDVEVRNCRFDGVERGNSITGKTRNIRFQNLFVNSSLILSNPPFRHYSQWMTYSEMRRTPKSYLLDFSSRPKWSYVMGIELEAMLDTYLTYGDTAILHYCTQYTDTMISPTGNIRGYNLKEYNLDHVRTGHFVARLQQLFPSDDKRAAISTLLRQLDHQPRTQHDSVFWHKAIYSYQVWLDGIFMGLPFRALASSMLADPKTRQSVMDDAVRQAIVTYQRTLDPVTDLNRHAWDETREMFWANTDSGQSEHCWGRAQGWYVMALVELLDVLPAQHPRRQELISVLNQVLQAVVRWQDRPTGLWRQVMDAPAQAEGLDNYLEATCSSMFAYALLKSARLGYVDEALRKAGQRAYDGIINRFVRVNPDSTLSLTHCCSVAGLGPGISQHVLNAAPHVKENKRRDGSLRYYLSEPVRDNDAKGIGPFIWASLEMERIQAEKKLQ